MTDKVIEFPETRYILRCCYCHSNHFLIRTEKDDPESIIGYECADCFSYWELTQQEIEFIGDS